ncbi:MAG: hypothetical protein IPN69_02425 [Acidobacteria bacterium]|nr:hypothetical protein [Acidobacteriota bacterium]
MSEFWVWDSNNPRKGIGRTMLVLICLTTCFTGIVAVLYLWPGSEPIQVQPVTVQENPPPDQVVIAFWRYAQSGMDAEAEKLRVTTPVGGIKTESVGPSWPSIIQNGKLQLEEVEVLEIDRKEAIVRGTVRRNGKGGMYYIHRMIFLDERWQIEAIHF